LALALPVDGQVRRTLEFWQGLLTHARAEKRNCPPEEAEAMERLMGELQSQIFARE
jgi:hypothetical protein